VSRSRESPPRHCRRRRAFLRNRLPASHELEWQEGRNPLTLNHVIVVDGAEMIGLKQLERLLAVVDKARAKVLLMGDSAQLEAMGSMSPLQGILDRIGALAPTGLAR